VASVVILAGAAQLIFSSCPCDEILHLRLGRMSLDAEKTGVLSTLCLTFLAFMLTWVAQLRFHRSVVVGARVCFVAAVLKAAAPFMPAGALWLTAAWLAFYVLLAWALQRAAPHAEITCFGVTSKLWELLTTLSHNGGTMLCLLVIQLLRPPADWGEWLNAPWEVVLQQSSVPLHVLSSIFASMLRDILLSEAEFNTLGVGMLVHHVATIGGCIMSFASPMGIGAMTLNAMNLELGSATFGVLLLLPEHGRYAQARNVAQKFYWMSMSASNFIGIRLALDWFGQLPVFWGWPCAYGWLGAVLVLGRQVALLMNMHESFQQSVPRGDDKDWLKASGLTWATVGFE